MHAKKYQNQYIIIWRVRYIMKESKVICVIFVIFVIFVIYVIHVLYVLRVLECVIYDVIHVMTVRFGYV